MADSGQIQVGSVECNVRIQVTVMDDGHRDMLSCSVYSFIDLYRVYFLKHVSSDGV